MREQNRRLRIKFPAAQLTRHICLFWFFIFIDWKTREWASNNMPFSNEIQLTHIHIEHVCTHIVIHTYTYTQLCAHAGIHKGNTGCYGKFIIFANNRISFNPYLKRQWRINPSGSEFIWGGEPKPCKFQECVRILPIFERWKETEPRLLLDTVYEAQFADGVGSTHICWSGSGCLITRSVRANTAVCEEARRCESSGAAVGARFKLHLSIPEKSRPQKQFLKQKVKSLWARSCF